MLSGIERQFFDASVSVLCRDLSCKVLYRFLSFSACVQGYRTGYAYRFPVLLERSRTRREVEVPATVTSFSFDDEGKRVQVRLQPHAHKQQLEKTRWLNTPNTYQKVNQDQASPGHRTTVRTTPAFNA